ncbi:2-oxo acid dehydrogenase subunit E2 [Gulosibacter molinativorax]|uniref:Dihydrolipoamide acetyltransferase component of pyruvate dehydrogenase complex n=1 Tax=Gulosibacter molinativorax TaxID=256821 RepID=A0ABT7CAY4_9MICO|nr:dihydrolipoamide acetyltransferase family protein [Gulosibacter molinativorax]MDJ1372304.1 branched-chain alpha-keto acid dehydrogenase subunit E2 [Gulosibacter molinativorax]QUY63398.1 Dihydrolipoamide acyltransferase BkdC [Gulosibacter molinativorax]
MTETQEFILPDLGEGLVEATIVEWKVAVGDEVTIDQLVVEVESAKSVVELPTPYAGRVVALGAGEGEVLNAGQMLLSVAPASSGEPASTGEPASSEAGATGEPVEAPTEPTEAATADAEPNDGRPGSATDIGRGWSGEDAQAASAGSEPSDSGSGAVLVGYGTKESNARLRRPEGGRFKRRRQQAGSNSVQAAASCEPGTSSGRADLTHAAADLAQATNTHDNPAASVTLIDERRNSPVMSPLVRREAQAAGFDARHLQGSGPAGLVVRADVQQAAAALAGGAAPQAQAVAPVTQLRAQQSQLARAVHPAGQAPAAGREAAADHRIPVEGMRAIVAEHMAQSHASVPKATIWLDADVTPLLELRKQLQDSTGERFSLTTLIARIVVAGLKQHPRLNASFDAAANEIVEHGRINLGIAAQTPRGLSVPVVHGASEMNLRELRDGIGELVAEAPRGKYSPSQLQGGTFTLNNYGGFGVDGSSPIINLPQAAMLGIGRLKERPWVVDGEHAVRTVMTVSFVFDHRVCDGDAASAFLTYVTDRMERPALLFADL